MKVPGREVVAQRTGRSARGGAGHGAQPPARPLHTCGESSFCSETRRCIIARSAWLWRRPPRPRPPCARRWVTRCFSATFVAVEQYADARDTAVAAAMAALSATMEARAA